MYVDGVSSVVGLSGRGDRGRGKKTSAELLKARMELCSGVAREGENAM
jgi:hypothetical protein